MSLSPHCYGGVARGVRGVNMSLSVSFDLSSLDLFHPGLYILTHRKKNRYFLKTDAHFFFYTIFNSPALLSFQSASTVSGEMSFRFGNARCPEYGRVHIYVHSETASASLPPYTTTTYSPRTNQDVIDMSTFSLISRGFTKISS